MPGSAVSALLDVSSLNLAAPGRRRRPFGRHHVVNKQGDHPANGVAAAQRALPACPSPAISVPRPYFARPVCHSSD